MGGFSVESGSIRLRCVACRQPYSITEDGVLRGPEHQSGALPTSTAPPPVVAEPAMVCPKCVHEQVESKACCRCGLLAERFDSYANELAQDMSSEVAAAWEHCVNNWEHDHAHAQFVDVAAAENRFAWAARRYTEQKLQRPGDSRCDAQLEKVSRMVEAALVMTPVRRSEPAGPRYKKPLILLIVLVFLAVAIGMFAVITQRRARDKPSSKVPPPPMAPGQGAKQRQLLEPPPVGRYGR